MKKITMNTTVVVSIIIFCSCTKVTTPKIVDVVVMPTDWVEYSIGGNPDHSYTFNKSIPDITTDVINNGTVLGYIKSSGNYYALPYIQTSVNNMFITNYYYSEGSITIVIKESDLFTSVPFDPVAFRFVVLSSVEKNMLSHIDINNYYEVSNELEL